MRSSLGGLLALALLSGATGLAGCNRSGSGAQTADNGAAPMSAGATRTADASTGDGGGYADAAERPPVPMFHGEPMWSENRRHTAKENAEYHFERAGQDLGARTLDDFLTKVHRFGDHPPPGTLKLTRPNGDRLLYDPKANLFAVFTREGAPRTVFKPTTGMDYWTEQKTRLAEGDNGYGGRSYGGSGARYGSGDRGYGNERGGSAGGDEGN